jgi:uncharacterized membrane protein
MDLTLIALARALHILTAIAWMGASLVMMRAIVPALFAPNGPGPWFATITTRIGPMAAGSSVLTVLTGVYMFWALHPHDTSRSGIVLGLGALMGLIAVGFGIMIGKVSKNELAHLTGASGDAAKLDAARRKLKFAAHMSTAFLVLSALGMATFRYAAAF